MGLVLPPPRLQLAALKLPPPGGTLLLLKLTAPLAAVAEPGVVSVTVAVQLVGLPTGTDTGEQLTVAVVGLPAGRVAGAQRTPVLVSCWGAVTALVPELHRGTAEPS